MAENMERIEVVPQSEFGSCAMSIERTPSGAVWLYQNDQRIYVGPEHVMALLLELSRIVQRSVIG